MNIWASVWAAVITGALILFSLLAVVVAVGGFFDIRSMFRTISSQHERQQDPDKPGDQDCR